MFRFVVLRDVLLQAVLIAEAPVARVTSVRLVGHVAAHVALQIGELREGFRAARVATAVRLFAGVGPDVLLQVAELREPAVAELAPVWFDAQVDPIVLG